MQSYWLLTWLLPVSLKTLHKRKYVLCPNLINCKNESECESGPRSLWAVHSKRSNGVQTVHPFANLLAVPWLRRVIRRPLTAEAGFLTRPVHVRSVVNKVALGQVLFFLSMSFHHGSPLIYHLAVAEVQWHSLTPPTWPWTYLVESYNVAEITLLLKKPFQLSSFLLYWAPNNHTNITE
jgi:hypothetical protein